VNYTPVQLLLDRDNEDGWFGGFLPPLLRDFHISEELGIGTVLGRVSLSGNNASDDDSEYSSGVVYRIADVLGQGNGHFSIGEHSGELVTQRELQSHLIPMHYLLVEAAATEGGRKSRCVVSSETTRLVP